MSNKTRILLIVILTALFTGATGLYDDSMKVDINTGDKVVSVYTKMKTVGEVLKNSNITIANDELVTPSEETAVTDNMQIFIEKAFMVNVKVDGVPTRLKTGKGTVKNIKDKMEKSIDMSTRLVGVTESDVLIPDMAIELVTAYTEKEEVLTDIPFEVVYTENDKLENGKEQVVTEGEAGVKSEIYELLYVSNKLVSRNLTETNITKAPVNKVIEKGTKKPSFTVNGTDREIVKTITMRASAYTTDRGDAGPTTATGEKARVGLVAVDPKFIPLGTWLYVEGYGEARAADTGGMIKGNAIDLFFNTYDECIRFGRRDITVHVLK